jgi:putative nucleotidyltransferase with HDIG domain/PAS domain S-box-containing protein
MIRLLISETKKALKEGYRVLRASGEMSWALRGHPGSEKLIEYEAKLNRDFFPNYPCLAICQYDRSKFDSGLIKSIIMTHPLIARKKQILFNHYYIPPEDMLSRNFNGREIDIWLENLEKEHTYLRMLYENEQKQRDVEEALRKRELQLNEAQHLAHIGSWELDLISNHLTWSDEIYRIFEISPKAFEASYEAFLQAVHPDDRTMVDKAYTDSVKNKTPYEIDHRLLMRDGRIKFVHEQCETFYNGKGDPVRSIGTVQDITEQNKREEQMEQSYMQLKKALNGTISAVAAMTELRDPYTAGHEKRVTQLACAIAAEMGLKEDEIEAIMIACSLHDIGKISIPSEILSKPTKLTDLEYEIIKDHSRVSHDIISKSQLPDPISAIVLQHHERMDGSGYPAGTRGKKICLGARILAVADVVEAMSSHRPYRPALGIAKALEEIQKNKDVLYDPTVVDVCLLLFRKKHFTLS